MQRITIKGVEYDLKYSIRGLFVFEKITGRSYADKDAESKLFDIYLLFYSMLLVSNDHFSLEVSEFIEACDDDPCLMAWFNNVLMARIARDKAITEGGGNDIKKKKANKK